MSYEPRNIKKKKKSFLQRAKKQGKSGHYGKGRQLSEEEYHYYIRVYEQLKHVEKDDKDVLVRNLFKEMEKDENIKSLSTNQIVSRILDDTLPLASLTQVISFLKVFSSDLRFFCVDPFASHVLQTLLTLCLKYSQEMQSPQDKTEGKEPEQVPSDEQREEFISFISKSSKFVYNNLDEFVCETYASHIVRTILEVCSGVEVSNSIRCSQNAQTSHSIRDDPKQILVVPRDLSQLVGSIASRLTQLSNFAEVAVCERGSAVLQTALFVLAATGETEHLATLIAHIVEQGFNKMDTLSKHEDSSLHPLFEYNSTCKLMEAILSSAASKTQLAGIFASFFSGNLEEIVIHKFGNFTIQRLLSSWKSRKKFSGLYNEVSQCLQKAFASGKTGVILALVGACRRLGSHQQNCLEKLLELMECSEYNESEPKFIQTLLYLIPLSELKKKHKANEQPPFSLHGTLILQELMNFQHNDKVVAALLGLSATDLVKMACDPRGCHVIEIFSASPHVKVTARELLISKLKGNLVTLACSKHGSRSLEDIWNVVGVKTKTDICKQLFENKSMLKESLFGKIIYTNFQIHSFNKRQGNQSWEDVQKKKSKKREYLQNMLEENDEAKPPKKKKKKKIQ